MSRFRKKSNFLLKILLLFSCCSCGCTTLVETQGEDESPVAAPQHATVVSTPTSTHAISSSTPRSILVLKISPNLNFKTSSSSTTDGDEFIRNINRRLEGYKKFVAEYDASRNNGAGGNNNNGANVNNGAVGNPALRNPHYSFEYPYKPPKEDLDYHTNAILYFIGISIVIAAIGVMSCLCINKSSCHKAVVGQMTANRTATNSNSAGGGRRHNNNNNLSRGSHATSNLSIITGTTTASSFSASPSVSNANFSASGGGGGLNGSSQSFPRGDANYDDTIHVKAIQHFDLPPSYDSLFPTAIENSVATPNTNTATDSTTTSTTNANAATNANDAVTLNVNSLETNKI